MSLSCVGVFVGLVWLFGDFQIPYALDDFVDARRRRHEELDLTRWELAGPERTWKNAIPEGVAVSDWGGRV